MKMKSFITCALLLLALLLPASAAAYDFEVDGIYYNYCDDPSAVEVTESPKKYSDEVTIPATVTYDGATYSVVAIGEKAFYHCRDLMGVNIPNSVTDIGVGAFMGCVNLASLVVASENPRYDSRDHCNAIIETAINTLIAGCNQTTIPNSVTAIGDYAFYYCSNMSSMDIPNSVTTIGNNAFRGCRSLTSMVIPDAVTTIGNNAFMSCSGLTSLSIGNSVATIGEYAFTDCTGLTSVTIPDAVTTIGKSAFENCSGLTSVHIGNSVTTIGDYAFYYCGGLKGVNIGNAVTHIGDRAFGACDGLKSLVVASENTKYDSRDSCNAIIETATNTLIMGCQSTIIPNTVTAIGNSAFMGCSGLTSINVPNSVTTIGEGAFAICSRLADVTIPNSVITVGHRAFEGTSWYNSQPDGVVYAGQVAYKYKGSADSTIVTLQDNTISITDYAFAWCTGVLSVTLSNSVTTIGTSAFEGCRDLASVTLGNSAATIGKRAFTGCDSLTVLAVTSGNPKYDSRNNCNAIIETASNTLIVGCKGTIIPHSVTAIGNQAFAECNGLTSVNLPKSVTTIGDYSFSYCNDLQSVTIPNSVTAIGEYAFAGCHGLKDVHTYITHLSSVALGDSVFFVWTPDNDYDYSGRTLHVPHGTADAYQADQHWYPYFGQIEEGLLRGDVNSDLEVNIADVNAIIDIILVGDGDITVADVNGDGEISIADLNAVIDIILSE